MNAVEPGFTQAVHLSQRKYYDYSHLGEITCFATRNSSCLDRIFVSDDTFYNEVFPFKSSVISDHYAVIATTANICNNSTIAYVRDQRRSSLIALNLAMDNFDFSYLLNITDIDVLTAELNAVMTNFLDSFCPLRRVVMKAKDPPFFTPEIKLLLRKRCRLLRKNRTRDANNISDQVRRLISCKFQGLHERGSQSWWCSINQLTGRAKPNRVIAFNPFDLNTYFADICTTNDYIPPAWADTRGYNPPTVSSSQVFNAVRTVKRTSPGIDGIPSWILRGNAHNLTDAITHLCNLSISQCYFPSSFKTSVIRPIPKVSNPMNRGDFRPISVTPILSRVFERIVYHNYVSGSYNAWINDSQFGFRKGCSTEQAVIKLQNDCMRFRNKAYCALYQIYRLRHMNFSPSDLKLMYESLVLSRLCYGLSVWGGEPDCVISLVDHVQRKACKLGICCSLHIIYIHIVLYLIFVDFRA